MDLVVTAARLGVGGSRERQTCWSRDQEAESVMAAMLSDAPVTSAWATIEESDAS
jgi:hypothetical protein